jgi:hypothetical protein
VVESAPGAVGHEAAPDLEREAARHRHWNEQQGQEKVIADDED